jgi:hypothetical protein
MLGGVRTGRRIWRRRYVRNHFFATAILLFQLFVAERY